jgi:hypothetical protein
MGMPNYVQIGIHVARRRQVPGALRGYMRDLTTTGE